MRYELQEEINQTCPIPRVSYNTLPKCYCHMCTWQL